MKFQPSVRDLFELIALCVLAAGVRVVVSAILT